jgi:thiol-disulfide isomerase/thioredoxin
MNELKNAFTSMVGGAVSAASSPSSDSGSSKYIMYAIVVALFLAMSYWAYTTYVGPLFSDFNMNVKQGSSKADEDGGRDMSNVPTAEIYLFKTDWCPHCKRAVPIFESVKNKYNETLVNGHRVIFRVIDCDTDTATADKFKVEGYPTIKLVKGSEVVEFDAKPEEAAIVQFMNTVI